MTEQKMIETAMLEGFAAVTAIDVDQIVFDPMFRPFCEENLCGHYGVNYTCPPDCGTPQQMEAQLKKYRRALVFETKWPITDYTDKQAIKEAKGFHNAAMRRAIKAYQTEGIQGLMAGASCCTLCEKCAIRQGEPCRFPEEKWSCLSAYCIFVRKLAEEANLDYAPADGDLTFFGIYAY